MPAHPQFVEDVLEVVRRIPEGRVMTYGDIAFSIGSRAARQVGYVMSHYGTEVAWWRVVPASGKPPKGHASRALPYYKKEGTPIASADTTEGYRLRLNLARLPFSHEIFDGALEQHIEQDRKELI